MDTTDRSIAPSDNSAVCAGGYVLTCLLCSAFFALNGSALQLTYGDSWIYTDLAKRIFFTHSLRMDAVLDLVYPPLYPALISIAYFFKTQAGVFNAIAALNILVYSTAFIPLYFLFKDYAQLNKTQAFCAAMLSVLCLWPLRYVVHVASEPLYYPLAAWFAWLLVDGAYLRGKAGLAAFTLVFTAMPLTKALGNIVFPAFILYSAAIYYTSARPRPVKLLTRPLLVIFISAFIVYLYKRYQFSVMPAGSDVMGGYLFTLSEPNLLKLSYWLERTRLDLSWLIRGTKTAALPMVLALFVRHRKLVYKDPLIIFTALVYAGTFLIVPLFTPTDPMFGERPRYYIPFVFGFIVMLLKYHRLIAGKELAAAALLTAAGIVIGFPPEFMREPVRWQIGAYYCVWFCCLYYGRKSFVNVFLALLLCTTLASVWSYRTRPAEADGSVIDLYDQRGITEKMLELRRKYPSAAFLVDRSWRGQPLDTWIEYERNMINAPFLPVFVDLEARREEDLAGAGPALLLTHRPVTRGVKAAQGKRIALYLSGRLSE